MSTALIVIYIRGAFIFFLRRWRSFQRNERRGNAPERYAHRGSERSGHIRPHVHTTHDATIACRVVRRNSPIQKPSAHARAPHLFPTSPPPQPLSFHSRTLSRSLHPLHHTRTRVIRAKQSRGRRNRSRMRTVSGKPRSVQQSVSASLALFHTALARTHNKSAPHGHIRLRHSLQ